VKKLCCFGRINTGGGQFVYVVTPGLRVRLDPVTSFVDLGGTHVGSLIYVFDRRNTGGEQGKQLDWCILMHNTGLW